ncbi:MAG: hypothetical protein JKY37_15220 [Nannocystaceae bacterium]|nr:hypothetical protein [Nannocystaceae bacterium]
MSTSIRLGFVSLMTLAASGCSDDADASTEASTTTAERGTSSGDTSGLLDDSTGPVADDSSTGLPSSTEGSSTGALEACPDLQEVAA